MSKCQIFLVFPTSFTRSAKPYHSQKKRIWKRKLQSHNLADSVVFLPWKLHPKCGGKHAPFNGLTKFNGKIHIVYSIIITLQFYLWLTFILVFQVELKQGFPISNLFIGFSISEHDFATLRFHQIHNITVPQGYRVYSHKLVMAKNVSVHWIMLCTW